MSPPVQDSATERVSFFCNKVSPTTLPWSDPGGENERSDASSDFFFHHVKLTRDARLIIAPKAQVMCFQETLDRIRE